MEQFDDHFTVTVEDEFSVRFKDPILYSEDFISLSKLQPSIVSAEKGNEHWRYWFRKVDEQGEIIQPELKFYFDLVFNEDQRLIRWAFSSLFLQIAPAPFLEASLRSLGGAKINQFKRQLKADISTIEKIATDLPKKTQVISQLGKPLRIKKEHNQDVYIYHFKLQTHGIEQGYEDRVLSVVKLSFDKQNNELVKMAGRFVGLKLSINYRKLLKHKQSQLAQMTE